MLIKKTVAISLTIAGSFHSIMALAWAQVAASVFSLIVNAYYSKVLLNYGLLRQLRDLTPSLMAAIPMGGVMWIVKSSAHESFYTELAIGLLSGGTVYLLLAYLFRMSPLREIAGLLLKSKKSTLTVEGM
jgi:teichuronic acid exporter